MRTRKTARSLFNQALCELLEPRQLMSITAYPTDGSTDSVQAQRSEAREIVVTLDTSDTLTTGDLALTLANGDGSGANDGSAGTTVSSVFGTPSLITGDEWAVPVNASVGTSTDASGSLTNGIYTLAVTDGADTSSTSFFRLQGDLNGDGTVNSSDTTLFDAAIGSSVGDPAYLAAADFNKDGVINASDDLQYSHHDLGTDFDFPSISLTASAGTVTGSTVALTADGESGSGYSSSTLTYSWASSPGTVSFSLNNSHAAASTTATFTAAGSYTFTCVVGDPSGMTAIATVDVTVDQTPTTLTITSGATTFGPGGTTELSATLGDQFGAPVTVAGDPIAWGTSMDTSPAAGSLLSGYTDNGASVNTWTAPGSGLDAGGTNTVTASIPADSLYANTLTMTTDPPVFTVAAAGTVTDTGTPYLELTSTAYCASSATDPLTYTWTVTNPYSQASVLSPSVTGGGPIMTNALYDGESIANDELVTMNTCGTFVFTCTATDTFGNWATTSVIVNIPQKFTSVSYPMSAYVVEYGTMDMTHLIDNGPTCLDQFGIAMASTPASGGSNPLQWSITSGTSGSVNTATGLYTAGLVGYADVELDWTNAYGGTGTGVCDLSVLA